jgi:hypothetical protein
MSQKQIYARRVINEISLLDFQINLSYELWDDIFTDNDVDIIFNNFLNTYLRIVNSCFEIIKSQCTYIHKSWLTPEIKKTCNTKTEFYKKIKSSNDPRLKERYEIYCKVLSRVIVTAKKLDLNKLITNSSNKTRTTWKIIKNMTGNNQIPTNVIYLNINGNSTQNDQKIVDLYSNFLLDIYNATRNQTNKEIQTDTGVLIHIIPKTIS